MIRNQAGNSKSPRVLRFRLMFPKSSWISRSGGEMERIDGNLDNSFWTTLRNRWRATWVRVEYSPKTYVIGIASRVSGRRKAQKHWSWKIWRSNHLHVNVQRHRWEHHESLILLEFMNQCFFPSSQQSQNRLYCMVDSAAVSFRFQASASIPTFNSRHRATCASCRIFRSLAQFPCHGRPRCCSRSDILVPLLGVRRSVVLNKAFFLTIGTGSHRSRFIPHFVIFGSEYPRAWTYRRRWRRWWARSSIPNFWLTLSSRRFFHRNHPPVVFSPRPQSNFESCTQSSFESWKGLYRINTEDGSIEWSVPWSTCLRVWFLESTYVIRIFGSKKYVKQPINRDSLGPGNVFFEWDFCFRWSSWPQLHRLQRCTT